MNQQKRGQKFEKYSIKKLKVGAASVLVGAGFFFGYHVEASEITEPTTVVAPQNNGTEEKEKDKSDVTTTTNTVVAETPKTVNAQVVEKNTVTEPVTTPTSVQTTELQEKVSALQTEVNRIRANKKQKSQIEQAEKLIEEAKVLQASKTVTQQEVDAKAKEISALTTILKSIKAEETVKENKNQDSRNGKKMQEGTGFRTDTATGTGISADVEDATSTPKVERPGYTNRELSEKLASQVTWLDFADKNHWTNIDEKNGKIYLKEDSVYENDVYPGYRIKIRIKSLKPFQATEIYRKRMEARGATDEEKATFDPNATNQYLTRGDGQGEPARVTASAQDEWSEIRDNGINTNGKKTSIAVDKPGSNWGVQFEISAIYNGKTVRPAVLMADAESANPAESIIFTTNGDAWQQIIELKKNRQDAKPYTTTSLDNLHNTELTGTEYPGTSKYNWKRLKEMMDGTTLVSVGQDGKKIAPKYFVNPDRETSGLGTGVFGPSITAGPYSVPVVMTKDATEVGMYVLSQGMQSAMMGVIPLDEGDAPESYGEAVHTINSRNTFTGAEVKQPYLGSNRPDPDTNSKKNWFGDDESGDVDEGVNQLLPDNLKGNEGSIIKANVSIAGNYTLTIQAHTGGAEKAYVRSWIDFNKNGKFDDDEASEIATITQDGTVELNFKNKTSTNVEKLLEAGTRVRISNTESEIVNPTGIAFSGEVEDFVAKITHPPKGEKKTTIGNIKETQREEIHFTAQGKNVYVREDIDAEIDATVQPTYIDNKTGQVVTLSSDGTYTVEGEGTYKFAVSDNGKDVKVEFTPADGFVGKANGISIRRQDTNKTTTDWGTHDATTLPNVNDSLNTMDGLYIPEVTPPTSVSATPVNAESQNLQGFPQKGKPTFTVETSSTPVTASAKYPAKLVDPRTNTVTELTTVDAFEKGTTNKIGTYTIVPETGEVTFTPNKDFKGIPAPATISADVELTHDKDGNVTTKTLTATYTPTIIPVEPTAIASRTSGPKGKPQTSPIKLDEEETGEDKDKTVNFNKGTQEGPNRERVELDPTTLTLVNDAGAEVESVTTTDGTYTLNKAEKTITFTPNEDFVGTAKPVNVRIKDANGTKADTTYTPTVRPVTTFVDSSGTPITVDKHNTPVTPEEDGTQPNKSIYGYKFVRTETDDKGNTKHVYETVKGNVLVKYVDETGAPLVGTASIPGNATEAVTADGVKAVTEAELGTSYDNKVAEKKATKITTADGKVYELVTENNGLYNTSDPATGTVTEADKVVTFVYKEKKSAVNVKYVDKNGQAIAGTATMPGDTTEEVTVDGLKPVTDASVNSDYTVTDKKATKITTADGKVYRLIAERDGLLDGSKPASGKVEENEITVTYQYELLGSVVTKYELSDGTELTGELTFDDATTPTTVEEKGLAVANATDVSNGTNYDASTPANKPNKITTATGEVYYLVSSDNGVKAGSATVTGTVEEGKTKEVTYVYEKAGSVVIKYINTDGTEIKATVQDSTNAKPGTAYNAAENDEKPATIEFNNKKYKLVTKEGTTTTNATYSAEAVVTNGENVGAAEGQVVSGKTLEVTYVYEEVKGNVLVKYVDETGAPLAGTALIPGNTTEAVTADGVKAVTEAELGTSYDNKVAEKKATKITTADGKVYELVTENNGLYNTSDPATGTVTEADKVVTFVYKEKKSAVNVKYVDKDGQPIAGTATMPNDSTETVTTDGLKPVTDASVNSDYNVSDKKASKITTADGKVYRLIVEREGLLDGSKPVSGKVEENEITVTYQYELVTGNVTVTYKDTEGNKIPGYETPKTVESQSPTGKEYTTVTEALKPTKITTTDGKVYNLVPTRTEGNEKGKVTEEPQNVTYVYELAKGNVTVTYKDTEGNKIPGYETPKTVERQSPTGKEYTTVTEALKPTKITMPDGKVYNLVPARTEGTESGKVTETPQNVTYVYELAKGDVTVTYKDTEGNKIPGYETPKTVETQSPTGKEYTTVTEALKPSKITTTDGKVYNLVPTRTEGNEKGKVTEEPQNVTYVYELAKGNVTVTYKDTEGNKIPGYETPKTVETQSPTGKEYTTVTEALKPSKITTPDGKVYNLVPTRTEGNENGKVTENPQNVTYVYELAKGNVTVKYENEAGETIKPDNNLKSQVPTGDDYNTTTVKDLTITKDGKLYKLVEKNGGVKEGSSVENGKVTETPAVVTYVYSEVKGEIIQKFVDESGKEIKDPTNTGKKSLSEKVNLEYPKRITDKDGKVYEFVKVDKVPTNFTEQLQTATYTYRTVKGQGVTVSYETTTGEKIKDSQTVQPKDTVVGTDYDTSTETLKPERIEKDGKVYLLKEQTKAGSAEEKGKVSEQSQNVTYVYEEVKEPETKRTYGSVVVLYTDQSGRPISGITNEGKEVGSTVIDTPNAPLNTKYDTTDNRPQTITTKDGKVYKLKNVTKNSDAEQSGVKGRTSVVTYVYEMLSPTQELPEAKIGVVLVNYQDEDGNPISGKTPEGKEVSNVVVDTDAALVDTEYDTTDNKPSVIIVENGDVYEFVKVSETSVEKGKVVEGTTIVDYIYRKVVTTFIDENGKEIKSSEKGTKSKVDISGYEFKETKKDEKGNTIHVYTKKSSSTPDSPKPSTKEDAKTTVWKDKDGNVIKTKENGKKEHSAINGYVYDHSEEDKDGNTTHIYRKVNSTTSEVKEKETSYVDEDGKTVQTTRQGQHPQDKISGYEFVRTETDANGNVSHVYRQVAQSPATVEQRKNELPNTGTGDEFTIFGAAAASILAGLGIAIPGKKKEEN